MSGNGTIEIQQQQQQQPSTYGALPTTDPDVVSSSGKYKQDAIDAPSCKKQRDLRRWSLAAGICYTLVIILSMVSHVGLGMGQFLDINSPDETATNLREHSTLFRQYVVLDIEINCLLAVFGVLMGFILYTAGVNPILSFSCIVFYGLHVTLAFSTSLYAVGALLLTDQSLNPPFPAAAALDLLSTQTSSALNALTTDPAAAWAFFFLLLHKWGQLLGLLLAGVYWSLLGVTILVSGIFSPWLGAATFVAGLGYVIDTLLYLLRNGYNGEATSVLTMAATVAKVWFAVTLLVQTPSIAQHDPLSFHSSKGRT